MRPTRILIVALAMIVLAAAASGAGEYIGAKKCKMCHKVQHTSWLEGPHAKAFERLKPEEQSKEECLKCHATGGTADLPGVQCEACHGAGSGYWKMSTMKDLEKAIAAGLVLPDEAKCRSCHENAPHDQPAFDYATAKEKGIHAHKKAE